MAIKKENKMSSVEIFLYLRQRLLSASDQKDVRVLMEIQTISDMLLDLAYMKNSQEVGAILENFESAARDSIQGVDWKSILPTEEEIKSALGNEETN
jgi:hypothetical protein